MESPSRAGPWKRDGKRLQQCLWRCFGLGRCFSNPKRRYMGREGVWRWLLIKQEIKEVQKLVLWELIINLASMHGEKGFHSPGKRATRREGTVPVQHSRRAVGSLLNQPQPQRDH